MTCLINIFDIYIYFRSSGEVECVEALRLVRLGVECVVGCGQGDLEWSAWWNVVREAWSGVRGGMWPGRPGFELV